MCVLRLLFSRCSLSIGLPRQKITEQVEKLSTATYATTVNQSTVEHHSKLSSNWWDPAGELRGLHALNHLRVQLIVDGLANVGVKPKNPFLSLEGIKILDVGCGGGILSEPLARVGANVTGIDASEQLIQIAKDHAATDPRLSSKINYVNTTVEEFAPTNEGAFDAVVASEVLEHVNETKLFVENCVKALKPGGSIFITTVNRTFVSWVAAIILAEHVLSLVPKGTHEWNKFVTPEETQRLVEGAGCRTKLIHGMFYNPTNNLWSWSNVTQISYAMHAVKLKNQS